MAVRYRVTAEAGEGGTVNPTEQWVPAGTSASIEATAGEGLSFVEWTGDVPAGLDRTNPLELANVTGAVSVAARFGDAQDIANAKLTLSGPTAYTYDGSEHTLTVNDVIAVGNRPLTPGVDYEVTGETAATDAGTYTVTVSGKGGFDGTQQTVEWTIARKGAAEVEWTYDATNFWYTGAAAARPTVAAEGLVLDRDFTVTNWAGTTAYAADAVLPVGTGYVTRVYGVGNFAGEDDVVTFEVTRQELAWTNASGDGDWASERWTLAEKPGMGNDDAREPQPTVDVAVYLQPTNGQENGISLASGATPFYSVATRGKDGATRLHDGVLPLTGNVTAGAGGRIIFENVTFTNASGSSTVYNVYPSGRGGQVTYLGDNRFDAATVGTKSYCCAPGFGNGDNATNLFMNGSTTVGTALYFTGTTTRDLYLVVTNATLQLTKIANAASQRLHFELKPGEDNCGEDKNAMLTLTAAPTFNANTFASVEASGLSAGVYNLVSLPTSYNILAATSPFAPERLLANTRGVGCSPALEVVTNDTVQTVRLTLAAVQVVDVPVRKAAYAGFTGSAVENPFEPGAPVEGVVYTVTDTNGAPASLDALVDCGAYRLTATLQDGYGWADGTTGPKDYVFAIIDLGRYSPQPLIYSNNGYLDTGIAIQKGVSADISFFTTGNKTASYLLAGKGNVNATIEYLVALRKDSANLFANVANTTVAYPDGGKSPAVANNESNRVSVALGTDNTLAMTVENERLGSLSASASVSVLTPHAKTLSLLAMNNNGGIGNAVDKFALYSATIWTNGTVTAREYLPFFDNERAKYGLYDIATGTFNESTRTAYPFGGPNDEFVWVGSEEDPGSGDWNDAQCWDYLGYGRGRGWPGQRTTDVAVFTSGTYRVQIPSGIGGKLIREYRDEPGVNLTVWTVSTNNTDYVRVNPGVGVVRGVVRLESSTYRKYFFSFNGGQPFEDYPAFYGTVSLYRNKEGLPFGSAFQYKGTNSTFVLEDCKARQGSFGYVFIGIYCADEDKDMPTRLVLTNSSWFTTTNAQDANSVGRNATLVYRDSIHMTGVISSHWGGFLDMSDSVVWYTSLKNTVYGQQQGIEEGDTIYLNGMNLLGANSKFAVSDNLVVTGRTSIVWPQSSFTNLAVEVSSGTYEGEYRLDLGLSPTPAPILAGTSADFGAADMTVDVSSWRGYLIDGESLPKRYPLVRTGSSATPPAEYAVTGLKAAVGTVEPTDDAEGIDLVIDYPANLTNSFPLETFDIAWDEADDGWKVTLTEDLTGPWEIADDIGRVILELDGHTITGTNAVEGAGGDAIVFTKMDPDGGLDVPTTLIVTDDNPHAHGGEPGIRGGDGSSGTAPGDGGAAIGKDGDIRDGVEVVTGGGAVVRGGNGGDGMNEEGVGIAGGKGGKGSVVPHSETGVGASLNDGDDGVPATAWAWCDVPTAAEKPQVGDGVARIGDRLWFYKRNADGAATFDFDLLRVRGWVSNDKTIHFVKGEIPVERLLVPDSLVAEDGYGELAFAGANWSSGAVGETVLKGTADASMFKVEASDEVRGFHGIAFAGADDAEVGAHDGGAISLLGGVLEVFDCTFENCHTGDGGELGGAIAAMALAGDSIVSNSVFSGCTANEANGSGGAIYASAETDAVLGVIDSSFEANAADMGGAISTRLIDTYGGAAVELVLQSVVFSGNEAPLGGAILAEGDVFVLDAEPEVASVFEGNVACEYGGAIAVTAPLDSEVTPTLTIGSNTVFACNVVSNDTGFAGGGAIAFLTPEPAATLDMIRCTFTNNLAISTSGGAAGGAIYADFGNPVCTIRKTGFYDNEVHAATDALGGAFVTFYGDTLVDNCVFDGNDIYGTCGGHGGALDFEGFDDGEATAVVKNSTFRRSNLEAIAGYRSEIEIRNCVAVDNTTEDADGFDIQLDCCDVKLSYSAYGTIGNFDGEGNEVALLEDAFNLPNRTPEIYDGDLLELDPRGFNPVAALGETQTATDFKEVAYGSRPAGSSMGAFETPTEELFVIIDGNRRYDGTTTADGITEFSWSVVNTNGESVTVADIGDITNYFELVSWEFSAADAGTYCATNGAAAQPQATIDFVLEIKDGCLETYANVFTQVATGEIEKRPVQFASASGEKVYDSLPLVKNDPATDAWECSAETLADDAPFGLVAGETVTFVITGSQTEAGSSSNWFEIVWGAVNSGNYDVRPNDCGTLTVTPLPVDELLVDPIDEYVYGGTNICPEVTVSITNELGEVITNLVIDTDFEVAYTNNVNAFDDPAVIVTPSTNFTGVITNLFKIRPRDVEFLSASASKVYDGLPLTTNEVKWTKPTEADPDAGILPGEEEFLDFDVTGSQTKYGSSPNTYTVIWNEPGIVSSNYNVLAENYGTLVVTQKGADDLEIRVYPDEYAWTGHEIEPTHIEVWDRVTGEQVPASDYTYFCGDNTDPTDSAKVTVVLNPESSWSGQSATNYWITAYTVEYFLDGEPYGPIEQFGAISESNAVARINVPEGYCLDWQNSETNGVVTRYDSDVPGTHDLLALTVLYETDANGDDVPDKYQKKMAFKVVNGNWNELAKRGYDIFVIKTLTLDDGVTWSVDGTATLDESEIPAVGARPLSGYAKDSGTWCPAVTETITMGNFPFFLYAYAQQAVPSARHDGGRQPVTSGPLSLAPRLTISSFQLRSDGGVTLGAEAAVVDKATGEVLASEVLENTMVTVSVSESSEGGWTDQKPDITDGEGRVSVFGGSRGANGLRLFRVKLGK